MAKGRVWAVHSHAATVAAHKAKAHAPPRTQLLFLSSCKSRFMVLQFPLPAQFHLPDLCGDAFLKSYKILIFHPPTSLGQLKYHSWPYQWRLCTVLEHIIYVSYMIAIILIKNLLLLNYIKLYGVSRPHTAVHE